MIYEALAAGEGEGPDTLSILSALGEYAPCKGDLSLQLFILDKCQ